MSEGGERNVLRVVGPPSLTTSRDSHHLILNLVMLLMKDEHGALPKEYWSLSRDIDFIIDDDESFTYYCRCVFWGNGRYPIVSLKTQKFDWPVTLLEGIKKSTFGVGFNSFVTLSSDVEELSFKDAYNQPTTLPHQLSLSARLSNASHLICVLHSTHGLGVLPDKYSEVKWLIT